MVELATRRIPSLKSPVSSQLNNGGCCQTRFVGNFQLLDAYFSWLFVKKTKIKNNKGQSQAKRCNFVARMLHVTLAGTAN